MLNKRSKPLPAGRKGARLYTPVDKKARERLRLAVAPAEEPRGRGLGYRGLVTDLLTGKRYQIYGKACGLAYCQCDAWAVEVPPERTDTRSS